MIVYETEDFRIHEEEFVKDRNGEWLAMAQCDDFVEGRWEPFQTMRKLSKEEIEEYCS